MTTTKKMTALQKAKTKDLMRQQGLDPASVSRRAFIEFARENGIFDGRTPGVDSDTETKDPIEREGTGQTDDKPEVQGGSAGEGEGEVETEAKAQAEAEGDLGPMEQIVKAMIEKYGTDEEAVKKLISEFSPEPREVEVTFPEIPELDPKEMGRVHNDFEVVLKAVSAGVNVNLIGPAGSGKTTLAKQVAEALSLEFFFTGAIQSEHKLLGFMDAHGNYVETSFYRAWTQGGLFLFDEIDGSHAKAIVALNAALANMVCDFPCGTIPAHENFVCIAAGNTYGRGANRMYVGRTQLDAASLDRFVDIAIDYDEALEVELAARVNGSDEAKQFVQFVQKARANANKNGLQIVVSPRASIHGSKLLAAGIDVERVKHMTLFRGHSEDVIKQLSR